MIARSSSLQLKLSKYIHQLPTDLIDVRLSVGSITVIPLIEFTERRSVGTVRYLMLA